MGYTLREIREILRASEKRQSPCPLVRQIIMKRIAATKTLMRQTMALQRRMEEAAKQWHSRPDAIP
ncbi:MAG: MerR family DNA-binding protein, partial [Burkholderiales bacterium]